MNPPSPLEAIFFAALEKGSAEDRALYLDEACAGDAELRRRVEQMLSAQADAGSFLEALPAVRLPDFAPTAAMPSATPLISEAAGSVIGSYKLLQQIGEGGFGVVFMAEQAAPVRRKVALKVIKPGMDTRQVIARFNAERQALAVMDHPNIARVFEAGATESGRPYFVMELVRGLPITAYCDEHNLPVRERLELFASVCQAIQHAHTKGIIHRDIKPTNVLVTRHDGRPVVKVIDFGVAKAMGQQLTEKTLFTEFAQMIGTPLYMSPEQAELSSLDIDTRSDIYSLGVLLYELLTGSTPVDKQELKRAAFDEIRRIIREDDPPRPSLRISDSETLPSIAAHRHTEPARLSKLVRGELDWIVMKALEKDRSRRYETASSFAADVERYLNDEAVHACPASAWYRFGKAARRNRVVLVTTTLVAAALMTGTVVSTWQAIRAEAARAGEAEQRGIAEGQRTSAERARSEADQQRALAEANFQKARKAVDEYFTLVSESRLLDVPGMQPLRQELLEAALRYYQAMLDERADDPAVLADLAVTHLCVCTVYHELDRNDDALAAVDSAVQLAERLRREYPDAVEHHRRLAGYWKVHRGSRASTEMPRDPAAAHRTLTRFLKLWESLARENPDVQAFQSDLASINNLFCLLEGGRGFAGESAAFDRAVSYGSKAVAIWEQLSHEHVELSTHRENLAKAYIDLAWVLRRAGQNDQANEAAARAAALQETLSTQFPDVPVYRVLAARKLMERALSLAASQPQEAEAAHREAQQAWEKLAADFPLAAGEYTIESARAQFKLAGLLAGPWNRPEEAIQVSQEAHDKLRKVAAEHPDDPRYRRELASAPRELARLLSERKDRWGHAEQLHLQSLAALNELIRQFPGEAQSIEQTGHTYRYLGWIMRDTGRPQEALDSFDKGIAAFQQLVEAGNPLKDGYYRAYRVDTLLQKVSVLDGQGRTDDAQNTTREVAELYEALVRDHPENHQWRQNAAQVQRDLAGRFAAQGEMPEAERCFRRAISLCEALPAAPPELRLLQANSHNDLAFVVRRTQGLPAAEQAIREALLLKQSLVTEFPAQPEYRFHVAHSWLGLAHILEESGRIPDAVQAFREGGTSLSAVATDAAATADLRQWSAHALWGLGDVWLRLKEFDEADRVYRHALETFRKLHAEFPARDDYLREQLVSHRKLAGLMLTSGQPQGAVSGYVHVLEIDKSVAAGMRRNAAYRNELAGSLAYLGLVLEQGQQPQQAIEAHAGALSLWKQLSAEDPDNEWYRQERAHFGLALAHLLQAAGETDAALAHCRTTVRLNEELVADFPDKPHHQQRLAGARGMLIALLATARRDQELAEPVEAPRPG